jgi:cytoskeletal protein RodZ
MKKYILLFVLLLVVAGGCAAIIVSQRKNTADSTISVESDKQPVNLKQADVSQTGGFGKTSTDEPVLIPKNEITLTVQSPADRSTVTSPVLKVTGTTKAGAEVFVNETETKADVTGKFSANITLDEEDNYIVVVANDENGNTAEAELTVIYQTP